MFDDTEYLTISYYKILRRGANTRFRTVKYRTPSTFVFLCSMLAMPASQSARRSSIAQHAIFHPTRAVIHSYDSIVVLLLLVSGLQRLYPLCVSFQAPSNISPSYASPCTISSSIDHQSTPSGLDHRVAVTW